MKSGEVTRPLDGAYNQKASIARIGEATIPTPCSRKRQLDLLVQQAKERFLSGSFGDDRLTLVAAGWAEFQGLATAPSQAPDTTITQDFTATGAAMGCPSLRMTRTKERAIVQHDRRRGPLHSKPRNCHGSFGRFREKFDFAEAQRLARIKRRFLNRLAVDEGAVRGTAIADDELIAGQFNFAMRGRNRGVFDLKIVFRSAAQAVGAQLELNHAVQRYVGLNQ